MQAVKATGLGKIYHGGVRGLTDFTLSVDAGQVFGLLGPNGAGKTTAVRLLNGTLEPSEGGAEVFGNPASHIETKRQTATLAEMAKLYENMSAVQNLEFFAAMYDVDRAHLRSRIHELLHSMGLKGREDDKIGTFSTGMKKRVQLARTLLHQPKLIFLDEPTSGLDPDAAKQVTELIRNLAQDEGTTVILCTHNLPMAETVCDTYGFLADGRLVASGSKSILRKEAGRQLSIRVVTDAGSVPIDIESEDEINAHLRRIMDSGAKIHEVRKNDPDLESLYFSYVGRNTDELA
jgi:ABC-2 type transport system ATP-binding protein